MIYQDVTKSVCSIAKYTKISESTIRFWIRQLDNGVDIMDIKEGRGRKKESCPRGLRSYRGGSEG